MSKSSGADPQVHIELARNVSVALVISQNELQSTLAIIKLLQSHKTFKMRCNLKLLLLLADQLISTLFSTTHGELEWGRKKFSPSLGQLGMCVRSSEACSGRKSVKYERKKLIVMCCAVRKNTIQLFPALALLSKQPIRTRYYYHVDHFARWPVILSTPPVIVCQLKCVKNDF